MQTIAAFKKIGEKFLVSAEQTSGWNSNTEWRLEEKDVTAFS